MGRAKIEIPLYKFTLIVSLHLQFISPVMYMTVVRFMDCVVQTLKEIIYVGLRWNSLRHISIIQRNNVMNYGSNFFLLRNISYATATIFLIYTC